MHWFRRSLIFALLVAAGALTWVYAGPHGWWQTGSGETPAATPAPSVDTATQAKDTAAKAQRSTKAAAEPGRPSFDIVRVEKSGEMVMAGVAPPGWTVRVETRDSVIGNVKAAIDGSWILLPDAPLPAGNHSLSVRALAPDGSDSVSGAERVAVSVAPDTGPSVVALSQESRPTRVLQTGRTVDNSSTSAAAGPMQAVAFSAVDYEDQKETGRLFLNGVAAPGARILLYLDNRFIGSTSAGAQGVWDFALTDILDGGKHVLRADHVDMDSGDVRSRAEVPFAPDAAAVAATQAGETRTALAETGESVAREQRLSKPLGNDEPTQAQAPGVGGGTAAEAPGKAVIVKQGDTLWHIAERHYGAGVRYSKIFRNNRDQIRNPNQIYPGQRFKLPQ